MSLVCPGGTVRLTQAGCGWECRCGAFGDGYKTWADVLDALGTHLDAKYNGNDSAQPPQKQNEQTY